MTRKKECLTLVAFFDTYPLRAKKAADFAIWREAVLLREKIPPGKPKGSRGRRGLVTYEQAAEIRRRWAAGEDQRALAAEFKVPYGNGSLSRIANGHSLNPAPEPERLAVVRRLHELKKQLEEGRRYPHNPKESE